jgi:hypothetical protein
MGFLARTKTADRPQAPAPVHDPGKKIILNFGGRASKVVLDMAAATLEAGGYPREPEIGDTMPDGTIFAGVSPDTGKAMYAMPADAPITMKFNEAQQYPKDLDVHGYKDWRLPTKNELNVLFNNRAAIGGFNVTGSYPADWYWSASENDRWYASCQRFSDGYQGYDEEDGRSSVRCVR